MQRTALTVWITTLFALVASCGGGGTSDQRSPLLIDLGRVALGGGALMVLEQHLVALPTGRAFEGTWLQNGAPVAPGRWVALSHLQLITIAPTNLPSGEYEVRIAIGNGEGRASVQLSSAPEIQDPVGALQGITLGASAMLASLQAELQSPASLNLPPTMAGDLARIESARVAYESELASASYDDMRLLATIINASSASALQSASSTNGLEDSIDIAYQEIAVGSTTFVHGAALVTAGLAIGANLGWTGAGAVVAAGLIYIGGLEMLEGGRKVSRATKRALAPADTNLQVLSGSGPLPGSSTIVISSMLDVQYPIQVTDDSPTAIRAVGAFATLSNASRSIADSRLQAILGTMDSTRATQSALPTSVTSYIETAFPEVPSQPDVVYGTILGTALSLEAQSNPSVSLSLAGGQLSASFVGPHVATSTTATFRYDAGALGAMTSTAQIQVNPATLACCISMGGGTLNIQGAGSWSGQNFCGDNPVILEKGRTYNWTWTFPPSNPLQITYIFYVVCSTLPNPTIATYSLTPSPSLWSAAGQFTVPQ